MPATPAWPPRSAPRLFITPALALGDVRSIDGNAAHYLGSVMRVRTGDTIIVCDDATGEWAATVDAVERRTVTIQITQHLRPRAPVPDFWLCIAPVKKPLFDLILEKATELGVARIVPVLTRRSVVDKVNMDRARTIMTEAAEQCARTALPQIAELVRLPQLLADWPAQRPLFMADEMGGVPAVPAFTAAGDPAAVLIGPEGGFDEQERTLLHAHHATKAITLGPRILRAETAALTATALWMAAAGDWAADR